MNTDDVIQIKTGKHRIGIIGLGQIFKDVREIGKYGIIGTPTLVINGAVKSMGQIPSKQKIKAWLKG